MVNIVASIERIQPLEAAERIWFLGEAVLGFPLGWAMTGKEINAVCVACRDKFAPNTVGPEMRKAMN